MEGTVRYVAKEYGTTLVVLEDMQITSIALDSQSSWTIGRAAAGNTVGIPLRSPIASRHHGMFMQFGDGWYYIDEPKNLNGTYCNGRKIPRPAPGTKSRVKLRNGDILRIDNDDLNNPDQRGVWMLFTTDAIGADKYAKDAMETVRYAEEVENVENKT